MDGQVSHQATWKKSVFQVYKEASIPFEWTALLKDECDRVGIEFFSALRRLGTRTWRGLHATGIYYLWFIFFTSYLGNLVEASPGFEQWLLAAAFGGLFLWRVGGGIARRLAARSRTLRLAGAPVP